MIRIRRRVCYFSYHTIELYIIHTDSAVGCPYVHVHRRREEEKSNEKRNLVRQEKPTFHEEKVSQWILGENVNGHFGHFRETGIHTRVRHIHIVHVVVGEETWRR